MTDSEKFEKMDLDIAEMVLIPFLQNHKITDAEFSFASFEVFLNSNFICAQRSWIAKEFFEPNENDADDDEEIEQSSIFDLLCNFFYDTDYEEIYDNYNQNVLGNQ